MKKAAAIAEQGEVGTADEDINMDDCIRAVIHFSQSTVLPPGSDVNSCKRYDHGLWDEKRDFGLVFKRGADRSRPTRTNTSRVMRTEVAFVEPLE